MFTGAVNVSPSLGLTIVTVGGAFGCQPEIKKPFVADTAPVPLTNVP